MQQQKPSKATVTSLAQRRKDRNLQLLRQRNHTVEQRVADLELDLLRTVDQLMDVTQRLEDQERYFRTLLAHLKNLSDQPE